MRAPRSHPASVRRRRRGTGPSVRARSGLPLAAPKSILLVCQSSRDPLVVLYRLCPGPIIGSFWSDRRAPHHIRKITARQCGIYYAWLRWLFRSSILMIFRVLRLRNTGHTLYRLRHEVLDHSGNESTLCGDIERSKHGTGVHLKKNPFITVRRPFEIGGCEIQTSSICQLL
jgi:hypothetical protein